MTSAVFFARYGFLALLLHGGVVGIPDGHAETDHTAEAKADQDDVQPVDRGKIRLELLLSLVKNELRAATIQKTQLAKEKTDLRRERAELSAIGEQRRPADDVRLGQIERRLETISQELAAIDTILPEIVNEHDDLERRLDEANGIVREKATAPDDEKTSVEGNDAVDPELTSASTWLDGKRQIQEALVYLGRYNALIDGDFGPRTSQAVKVYQERQSLEATGVLTKDQEVALLNEAQSQRALYGVEPFRDEEFGYWLSYPTLLLSEMKNVSAKERRMTTKDGKGELLITVIDKVEDLTALYEDLTADYEIQYRRKRDDWFVVAGLVGENRIIYDTVRKAKDKLVRARLSYPADQRDLWSPFAVIMFNTFNTLPTS